MPASRAAQARGGETRTDRTCQNIYNVREAAEAHAGFDGT
jgi:hypothetical protein